jgi:hypothetical protein
MSDNINSGNTGNPPQYRFEKAIRRSRKMAINTYVRRTYSTVTIKPHNAVTILTSSSSRLYIDLWAFGSMFVLDDVVVS